MDLKRAAKSLGAADLGYSDRRNKKISSFLRGE